MLVYFYERNSDELQRFNQISPSRSIINPAFCVSNGYVVFVPDITYIAGYPGESAYGGIRWESGVSRVFQYEKSQSRIGGTLWEKPNYYLANSPVSLAD